MSSIPEQIVKSLGDKLAAMTSQGIPFQQAVMTLTDQLVNHANVARPHAIAMVELGIEAHANKYQGKRVYTDDQLKEKINFLAGTPGQNPPIV
jgi:hypothetical protein